MTATTKPKTPTLRGQTLDRAPASRSTLEDPLYVAVSRTSTHDVAWAAIGREYELTNQGYEVVRPEELERLPGGSYLPHEKHFGVRFFFDKDADAVRHGQHMLMKLSKKERSERMAEESRRMSGIKPARTDKAEQAKLEVEAQTTVGDELKSK